MRKSNFYYQLRQRLIYANEYSNDMHDWLLRFQFSQKVEKEFHKDKIILSLIIQIINLPSEMLRSFRYWKGVYYYNRSIKEIEIIKKELKNYRN